MNFWGSSHVFAVSSTVASSADAHTFRADTGCWLVPQLLLHQENMCVFFHSNA